MYLHFISDLPTEMYYPYTFDGHVSKTNRCGIHPSEEIILVLAGELGYVLSEACTNSIHIACQKYDHVFWLPEVTEEDEVTVLKEKWRPQLNLTILYREKVLRYGIYFIATPFYPSLSYQGSIVDFLHNELEWVTRQIEEQDVIPIIMITNFLPASIRTHKTYQGNMIEYMRNICHELIKSPVQYWLYGHSSQEGNISMHNVSLVTHPRGYLFQHNHFKPKYALSFV